MRVVVRVLFFEFSVAWAMMLAGAVRAGVQVWPVLRKTAMPRLRGRAWRVGAGLAIGVPVTVGWPLLFWFLQARRGYAGWLPGIAIPWWIVLGGSGLVVGLAKIGQGAERADVGAPGCHCGTCMGGNLRALSAGRPGSLAFRHGAGGIPARVPRAGG